MFLLAYRQLAHSPLHTLLTAAALAAVVAVILVLEGFALGLLHQSRRLVMDRQADLIVVQAGVSKVAGAAVRNGGHL